LQWIAENRPGIAKSSSWRLYFVRRNRLLIPPPILALVLLLACRCLMAVIPLSPIQIPAGPGIGVLLLILGFAAGYSGFSAFLKAGTPVRPGDEPTKLVTIGPYRLTRNPMYLGLELDLLDNHHSMTILSHKSMPDPR
jgi:protein-S-isoprenylcysteine O-methyltransferase Ste14